APLDRAPDRHAHRRAAPGPQHGRARGAGRRGARRRGGPTHGRPRDVACPGGRRRRRHRWDPRARTEGLMEPADYLKILQRHWKVAVVLVAVLMLGVFIVAPKQPATVYEARHTLLRDVASGDEGASSADNPSVVAL